MLDALDQMDTDMDVVDGCALCSLPQSTVTAVLEPLIARYAYDLVYLALEFMRHSPYVPTMQTSSTETWVHFIPDLTELP